MSRARPRPRQERARDDALFGLVLFVVALVAAPLRRARVGAASRCGTATTTTSARAASPQGLGYSDDVDRSAGRSCGTRGATTRSATARFSARLLPRLRRERTPWRAVANALVGRRARRRHVAPRAPRAVAAVARALAGLLVALHPGLILYAALLMTEPLAALLTLVAFWSRCASANATRGIVLGRAGPGRRGAGPPAGALVRAVSRAGAVAKACGDRPLALPVRRRGGY